MTLETSPRSFHLAVFCISGLVLRLPETDRLSETSPRGEKHPFKLLLTNHTRAMDICGTQAAINVEILDLEDDVSGRMYDLNETDLYERTAKCLRSQ